MWTTHLRMYGIKWTAWPPSSHLHVCPSLLLFPGLAVLSDAFLGVAEVGKIGQGTLEAENELGRVLGSVFARLDGRPIHMPELDQVPLPQQNILFDLNVEEKILKHEPTSNMIGTEPVNSDEKYCLSIFETIENGANCCISPSFPV